MVSDDDEADETIMMDNNDTFDTESFATIISKIRAVAKSI